VLEAGQQRQSRNVNPAKAMSIKKIDRAQWVSYFDTFSKRLIQTHRTDYAEIRVFSPEDGAQPETSWLPLAGITYDPRSDLLEVLVENMDHLVLHPEEIYVDETATGILSSLEVIRKDGTKEIVEVR
jgi:hypothetical protein